MNIVTSSSNGACHELVPIDEPLRWRRVLEGIPHGFGHTWESCRAIQVTTACPTHLYHYHHGDVRIACPLVERAFDGVHHVATPYGMSGFTGTGEDPHFPRLWHEFARELGWVAGCIGLNPLLERPSYGHAGERHERHEIYALDLTRDDAALVAGLSQNRRRQLRAWHDGPGRLDWDRAAVSGFLMRHANAFFEARGASEQYRLSRDTWRMLLGLPGVLVVGAEFGGHIEAASVFGWTQTAAEYLFNVSVGQGITASAPLLWFGALRLRELGVPVLNLGGGIRPGDGVARFKERFGARLLPVFSLLQVYDAKTYEDVCRRAGVDAEDRSGDFPPWRA